jgi:hypothetical protein
MIYNNRAGDGVTITPPAFNVLRETMTMHDIKELVRQHEAAISRKNAANVKEREAANALYDARVLDYTATLLDRGISIGTKVSVKGKVVCFNGFSSGTYRRSEPEGRFTKLKKDGTAGMQGVYVYWHGIDSIKLHK